LSLARTPMTNENATFLTERLPLAIFFHATQRLRLSRCERVGEKVQFIFADPEQIGNQAELDFENGECVPAKSLFASQTFLRRQMSDALNRKDNENRKLEYAYHHRS
jgi:hypothetical protein